VADSKRRLYVGADGVTLQHAKGQLVTVRYQECAGVLAWDNGDRVLFGDDGFMLPVTAERWLRGRRAVKEIDAHVADEIIVPMGVAPPRSPVPRQQTGASPGFSMFMRVVGWIVLPFMWLSVLGAIANFFDPESRRTEGMTSLVVFFLISLALAGPLTWGMVRGIRKRRREKNAVKTVAQATE
jgi:hypothetical protein